MEILVLGSFEPNFVFKLNIVGFLKSLSYCDINRIYNKILDRDWFSAFLFVTLSARDHVGVQLQVSNLNFL